MLPNRCGALPGGLFVKQISFLTVSVNYFLLIIWLKIKQMISEGHFILTVPDRSEWAVLFWLYQTGQNRGLSQRPFWPLRGFVTVRLSPAKSGPRPSHDVTASPLIIFKLEKAISCDTIWGLSGASLLALIGPTPPPRWPLEPHWGVPFSLCNKFWYKVINKMWYNIN